MMQMTTMVVLFLLFCAAPARAQDDCTQNPYCAAVMLTEQIIQQYGLQNNPIQQGRAAAAAAEWYGIATYDVSPLYWTSDVLPSSEEEFENTVTLPVCYEVDGEIRCSEWETYQRKCATEQQMAGLSRMEGAMSWLKWVYTAAGIAFPQFITSGAELAAKQLKERADAGGC
jgi:hypothetical protein